MRLMGMRYLMARYDCFWSVEGRMHIEYPCAQLLSLFAAVPPLISTAKLIYASRWKLLHFLQRLPRLFSAEVRYLFTGVELDPPVQDSRLPLALPRQPPAKRATI